MKKLIELAFNFGFGKKSFRLPELQEWFRDNHGIEVWVVPTHLSLYRDKSYRCFVEYFEDKKIKRLKMIQTRTYDESLELGLLKAFEFIKPYLKVTINQSGGFYRAFYNTRRISRYELESMLKNDNRGYTLQYRLDKFAAENPRTLVEYDEIDVS